VLLQGRGALPVLLVPAPLCWLLLHLAAPLLGLYVGARMQGQVAVSAGR